MNSAVLDTSAFVAALINPLGASGVLLREQWRNLHAFDLVTCPEIIAEYREVAARPHIVRAVQRRGGLAVVQQLLQAIEHDALRHDVEPPFEAVCADPDDDVFFACARAASATYLVSLDRVHILPIGEYAGVQIVSPATLLEVLRSRQGADPVHAEQSTGSEAADAESTQNSL